MANAAAAPLGKHHHHSIGFNLGLIAVGAAILGLGLAYLLNGAARPHTEAAISAGMVARSLGGTALTIPANWLTEPADGESFAKQVDIALTLPLGPSGSPRRIDVTLTQRSRVLQSAALLDGVYLHEFQADQLTGPPGLIGKPLVSKDGFENETVWYDPINPAPFVAKCAAPITNGSPGRCLRTVYLGPGIAAVYRFDEDTLSNWRKFDAEMHPLLDRIGAL
jgi:hypothetical protein